MNRLFTIFSIALIINLSLLGIVFSNTDKDSDISDITNSNLKFVGLFDFFRKDKSYNVFFYFPDNRERHLGLSKSISDCQSIAINYADQKNIIDDDWGYVCCLKTKNSECAEKHK